MRCLKRRLSDVVYKQMRDDAQRLVTGPGGQSGAANDSCAVDFIPDIDASDQSLPGPATGDATALDIPAPDRFPNGSARPVSAPKPTRQRPPQALTRDRTPTAQTKAFTYKGAKVGCRRAK